jgi:hypothetical protein
MKHLVRSVPAVLFLSSAVLFPFAFTGCSSSGSGALTSTAPAATKNVYALEHTYNTTTSIEQDTMVVYSASATGSATPTSTLALPNNFEAFSIAIGPTGTIYIGGQNFNPPGLGQVLQYPAGSSGSVTPSVTLNGSSSDTSTFDTPYYIAVNSAGTLFVSAGDGSLEAFASGFTASSAPTQYLTWGMTNFLNTGGEIGVDTAGDVFYLESGNQIIRTPSVHVFAAGATGATSPVRSITGTNTTAFVLLEIQNMAVDGAGDVYLSIYNDAQDPNATSVTDPATSLSTGIIEFAAGATGNATPLKQISGTATYIVEPMGLTVDAASNLYYVDAGGSFFGSGTTPMPLEVFPSSATGNVPPATSSTLTGYTYGISDGFAAIAVY